MNTLVASCSGDLTQLTRDEHKKLAANWVTVGCQVGVDVACVLMGGKWFLFGGPKRNEDRIVNPPAVCLSRWRWHFKVVMGVCIMCVCIYVWCIPTNDEWMNLMLFVRLYELVGCVTYPQVVQSGCISKGWWRLIHDCVFIYLIWICRQMRCQMSKDQGKLV